jgi:streptogramin lyase
MMRLFILCLAPFACLIAQAGEISTVAGTGQPEDGGAAGPALKTNIGEPFGVQFGPDGKLYITEVRNHRVRRLDLGSGKLDTVAGTGKKGYSGDAEAATKAELNEPYETRFDSAGDMYFVEMQNHVIRRVDAKTGVIRTIAGTGKAGFAGDGGPATKAEFRQPHSIALDDAGNVYVADIGNHCIRRIDGKTDQIDSIAGTGEAKLPQDGGAAKGQPVLGPRSLFVQGRMLWVCLREGNSVWRLELDKDRWQHAAGTGKQGYSGDGGPAKEATFAGPKGIALNAAGDVFVADTENQAIRRIDAKTGVITTIAGAGPKFMGELGDGGGAIKARLARPHGVCVGPDDAVYIGDSNNHRVRRVTAN